MSARHAPPPRRRGVAAAIVVSAACFVALGPSACSSKEPEASTYFTRTIGPILTTSCVRTNTGAGCHVEDAKGNALGNLDTAGFEGVAKRRDLLADYGPYGQSAFLLKNIDAQQIEVQTYDGQKVVVSTDIKHAGGSILDASGGAYQTLRRWIANGATENNTGQPPTEVRRQPCNAFIPARGDFDVTKDPATPDFALFRDRVNPLLVGAASGSVSAEDAQRTGCAAGNCHGTVANSLYLTCGATPEQLRFNYLAAVEYLAQTPEQSELLRRPLAPAQGGAFHEGGVVFGSPSDPTYVALFEWAAAHGPPKLPPAEPGFAFFSQKVQPLLVKKGCMMLQCHSASMFHDYRLRGGSGGSFSLSATRKNYELSLAQMALESDDVTASRLVRKNLYRPEVCGLPGCDRAAGILHRGGPLLEDFGGNAASATACDDAKYDYDGGKLDDIPTFCVMNEWLKRERAVTKPAPLSAVIYVKRPLGGIGRPQDFDVYAPGADLRRVLVTLTPAGALTPGADTSLTDGCGLAVATADIRRPAVSFDGAKVAFAARASASEPFAIYEMNADGTACARHPEINAGPASANGLLIHNFDPAYSPIEGEGRIVFASTRGNLRNENYDYQGPQRSPADPTKPNSNLYVWEPNPKAPGHRVRQLTFLLNMERMPSFMSDGRVIFTAEKRAPSFYQLALRRINLDGGDYHPLYAQRSTVGYPEATDVVELPQKDFAAIFRTPQTPHGGGALAVFNRSIGIDFTSTDVGDYLVDPGVIDATKLQSPDPAFFLRSLLFPDRGANARVGQPTSGIYASPAALPNGALLVSVGATADVGTFNGDYDLFVMNPGTGVSVKLLGEPGSAEVDAVAVYGRVSQRIFKSTLDEPNGHTTVLEDRLESEVLFLSLPVLGSLMFQNTPTGRVIEEDLSQLIAYEDLPPPTDMDSFDKGGTNVVSDAFGKVYVRRRQLGVLAGSALADDGSAKIRFPGGVPIVLQLGPTKLSRELNLPRTQREQMVFYPGEYAHQSFRPDFFNALCGTCHGAVSGRAVDAAIRPDILTQASAVKARDVNATPFDPPPSARGPIEGPPQGP